MSTRDEDKPKEEYKLAHRKFLTSLFRRIVDGAYYPASDYLAQLAGQDSVSFAKRLLHNVEGQVMFDTLCDAGRPDLTIELSFFQPPWRCLFEGEDYEAAEVRTEDWHKTRRFEGELFYLANRLEKQSRIRAGSFSGDVSRGWREWSSDLEACIAVVKANIDCPGRYTDTDLTNLEVRRREEYGRLPVEEQMLRLNQELAEGYPFTPFLAHRAALSHSVSASALQVLLVCRAFQEFDSNAFARIRPALAAVQTALNLSDQAAADALQDNRRANEIGQILQSIVIDDASETKPTEIEESEVLAKSSGVEEDDSDRAVEPIPYPSESEQLEQARLALAWRAIDLARLVGCYIGRYNHTHPPAKDVWLQWRKGVGDPETTNFIIKLSDAEFFAALFVQNVSLLFDQALYSSSIYSNHDIEPVPGVFAVDTDLWGHLQRRQVPEAEDFSLDGVDPFSVIEIARRATLWDITSPPMAPAVTPSLAFGTILGEIHDLVQSNTSLQLPIIDLLERIARIVDQVSKTLSLDKRQQASASLRAILGDSAYDRLCARARTALLGTEYLLLDPQIPDPTHIVVGMAVAFERQLYASVLEPFCEFLREKGVQDFPEECFPGGSRRRPLLVRRGEVERKLTLEKILQVLESADPAVQQFSQAANIDLQLLKRTIRRVRDIRNPAAHEGGISFELARQFRDEWLNAEDRTRSVFWIATLGEPCGSPQ